MRLQSLDLPMFSHPCLYAGNFNCCHAVSDYKYNSLDGECFAGWANINILDLLYNPKDAASFYFGLWNTVTNPDLAFASVSPYNCIPRRRRLLDRYLIQVRHKQDWDRGFILLLHQAAVLPESDADSDVVQLTSSFVIQNRQTSCLMWCPMYNAGY